MKHIVLIVGARPNFMKLSPVYDALKMHNFKLTIIHTGQHSDFKMSDIFFQQLNLPINEIVCLDINSSKSQCEQIGEILITLGQKFREFKDALCPVDLAIVFGDVTSTLAGALTSQKNNIPIAHIESGNRSYDKTMPEEINRIIVDSITTYYFISEPNGFDNLVKESLITEDDDNWFYVGNPMIDTLYKFRDRAYEAEYYKTIGVQSEDYILLTVHRPSNVDDTVQFDRIIKQLDRISDKYKIIFPVHHRRRAKFQQYFKDNKNIILLEPLGYIEFMNLMMNTGLVITDSGGLQEETTVLNIPCITIRPNTERPITCTHGTNLLLTDIDELDKLARERFNKKINVKDIKFWDGHAGERIAAKLNDILNVRQKMCD